MNASIQTRVKRVDRLRRPLKWLGLSLAAAAGALTLAGCDYLPKVPTILPTVSPYRMEIQQGNYISQQMVDQLKPGMSKEQVRFVLGTPLVTDIFHGDRWDYIYFREASRTAKPERRRLSVFFKDERLERVGGDVVVPDDPPASAVPAKKN